MTAFGFLNPLLLWGLLAASIPIIIHLLNRRRFKTVRWAAMEYLLAAMKENKRRIRLEQLLLLLLRTAIVAFLVFMLARPTTEGSDLFGLLRTRAHHVVLIDDSGSMGQRIGNTTFFGIAQEHVEQLVQGLRERRPDDVVTVIRASRAHRPDFTTERPAAALIAGLQDLFREATPFPDRLPPGPLLEEGAKRVTEVAGVGEDRVYLVSDFRHLDWIGEEGQPAGEPLAAMRKYDLTRTRFLFLPVGSEDVENLSVLDVRRKDPQAVVGVPATFEVVVANRGVAAAADADLTIEVDGSSRILRALPSLSGGETTVVSFTHTFRDPGSHHVTAAVPGDRLPLDDRRSLALQVAERTRAVVADGDPGERTDMADSFFLAAALDPGGGQSVSGIGVEVVGDHVLSDKDLLEVDLLVLANVPVTDEALVTKLEDYVRGGGGLLVFVGDQVDATLYNNLLFKKGEGLLPCALVDVAVQDDDPLPMVIADTGHETVAKAQDLLKVLLGMPQVGRYYTVAADVGADPGQARPEASVILRFGDEDGPPAVVAKTFGKGKVVLFTMPADMDWTGWPNNPSYVTFLQQVHEFAVRTAPTAPFNVTPRTSFTHLLDAAAYAPEVSVRRLSETGDEGRDRVFTAVPGAGSDEQLTLTVAELGATGVYRAQLRPHGRKEEPLFFSVSPDPREGILHRVGKGVLPRVLPGEVGDRVTVLERSHLAAGGLAGDEGEMWKILAAVVAGFLLLETLLAWRFGHR